MTYNVFSGTLNPTHFTSLRLMYLCFHCKHECIEMDKVSVSHSSYVAKPTLI